MGFTPLEGRFVSFLNSSGALCSPVRFGGRTFTFSRTRWEPTCVVWALHRVFRARWSGPFGLMEALVSPVSLAASRTCQRTGTI